MTPVSPANQLLTVQNAALFSGISESMVRNMVAHGELPVKRLGRRILIERQIPETLIRDAAASSTS